MRPDGPNAVVEHQADQMSVRHEVAGGGSIRGHLAEAPPETLLLAGSLDVRAADERLDVRHGFRDRKRTPKDGRMCGDPQVGHDRRPEQVDDLRACRRPGDHVQAASVMRARLVRRVQENVGIQRVAHRRAPTGLVTRRPEFVAVPPCPRG